MGCLGPFSVLNGVLRRVTIIDMYRGRAEREEKRRKQIKTGEHLKVIREMSTRGSTKIWGEVCAEAHTQICQPLSPPCHDIFRLMF